MAGGGLHCNSQRFRLDGSREAGDNPCPLQSPCSFSSASASSLWFVPTPTLSHCFTLLPAALLSFPNPEVSQGAAYVHISHNPHAFPLCLTETGKHTYTLSRVWPPVPYLDWGVSPSSCPELRPFPTRRLGPPSFLLTGAVGVWADGNVGELRGPSPRQEAPTPVVKILQQQLEEAIWPRSLGHSLALNSNPTVTNQYT